MRLGLNPVLLGTGIASDQSPEAGVMIRRGSRITVQFARDASADACGRQEEDQVTVKVDSVVEHNEDLMMGKRTAAARAPLRLAKLLRGVDLKMDAKKAAAHGDLEILEIAYDSRRVKPGTLFVAIRGEKTDGNQFVSDAVARGAIAIASEQPAPSDAAQRVSPGFRLRKRARRWPSWARIILAARPKS